MTALRCDINVDAGETPVGSVEHDLKLLKHATSISIACGGHAGDTQTARTLIEHAAALERGIGAHPGYVDRANFGRRAILLSPAALRSMLDDQLGWLCDLCEHAGTVLQHVKPHGALYHAAATSAETAQVIGEATATITPASVLLCLPGSIAARVWQDMGLAVANEAFADRRYDAGGGLRPRSTPDALLTSPREAGEQAVSIVRDRAVRPHGGGRLTIEAQTLCVHSDTPGALAIAAQVRTSLEAAGVRLTPLSAQD